MVKYKELKMEFTHNLQSCGDLKIKNGDGEIITNLTSDEIIEFLIKNPKSLLKISRDIMKDYIKELKTDLKEEENNVKLLEE